MRQGALTGAARQGSISTLHCGARRRGRPPGGMPGLLVAL